MLHEFLIKNREEVIARTRELASHRTAPRPTEVELKNGIPLFLSQLVAALQTPMASTAALKESATLNGRDLLQMGMSVGQVIHCYGDLCQTVTAMAMARDAKITPAEFHTFNGCLDEAMAHAVTEYASERDRSTATEADGRLGEFAHEMRNLLNSAMLAYELIKRGSVGITSSTGAVLDRSLRAMASLNDRSIAEVRLQAGAQTRERVVMAGFIEEVEVAAILEANARQIRFSVSLAEYGVAVEADRQSLAAAVTNLLQNAFKFTRPLSHVSLTVLASAERVLIEVEDECGGLPPGKIEELFQPFAQHGADRTGLGLGLAISRQAVEASGGELRVRDLPGRGCVFTIDMPRLTGVEG